MPPKSEPGHKKPASEQKRREIRTMRDAVDEIRVYGEGKPHSAESAEKSPRPKKRRRKKRALGLISRLLVTGKKLRRSGEKKLTLFGRPLTFWPMFILAFAILMVIVLFLNSANLTSEKQDVTLVGLAGDLEDFQILVLSDLNGKRFGDQQATLMREIGKLDYDIVVCLGDMVGKDGDPAPFYELLNALPKSKKVYFICGDSDPGPYGKAVREESAALERLVLADWILGAMDRGAIYVDSPTRVAVGSYGVWLTPANMLNLEASQNLALWKDQAEGEEGGYLAGVLTDKASLPFTCYRQQLAQELLDSINQMKDSEVQVILAHVPPSDYVLEAAASHSAATGKYLPTPDLALAGHYCGGVWNLPGIGAFYIPDSSADRYGWFPAQEDVSGLSQVDETQLYISRGLSTSGDTPLMPFRMLNSPQISVITLTAELPTSMLD